MAEAGWEPVTYARTGDANVYLERFGPDDAGNVYLTVLNDSDEGRVATIQVQTGSLSVADPRQVTDLVTGEEIDVGASDSGAELTTRLGPEQVRVLLLAGAE